MSSHTKLTLERKFLLLLLPEFKLTTFRSRVRHSYQPAKKNTNILSPASKIRKKLEEESGPFHADVRKPVGGEMWVPMAHVMHRGPGRDLNLKACVCVLGVGFGVAREGRRRSTTVQHSIHADCFWSPTGYPSTPTPTPLTPSPSPLFICCIGQRGSTSLEKR